MIKKNNKIDWTFILDILIVLCATWLSCCYIKQKDNILAILWAVTAGLKTALVWIKIKEN